MRWPCALEGKAVRHVAEVQQLHVEDVLDRGGVRRVGAHVGPERVGGVLAQPRVRAHRIHKEALQLSCGLVLPRPPRLPAL